MLRIFLGRKAINKMFTQILVDAFIYSMLYKWDQQNFKLSNFVPMYTMHSNEYKSDLKR